jgi:hypothetical protein
VVGSEPKRCCHAARNSGTDQNAIAGKGLPKFPTGGLPATLETINSATVNTCSSILNFPIFEAEITTPSAAAIERKPVTANSRPMIITTAHAGASWFSTREIKAAEISSLSAMGSSNCPKRVT